MKLLALSAQGLASAHVQLVAACGEEAGLRQRDVDLDAKAAIICQRLQQNDIARTGSGSWPRPPVAEPGPAAGSGAYRE